MSITKSQKKLEKKKKNYESVVNQAFAIFYAKDSTISSSKKLNIWGSGGNSQKASERQQLRKKNIIKTKLESQGRWKRRKGKKSIELFTHHNIINQQEALCLLQENKLYKTLKDVNVKSKQIRKGIYPLETLLRKNFKWCTAEKKQLAIFIYYFPRNFYTHDPITAIVDAWADKWTDKKKLRKDVIDAICRLKIVFEIKDHFIIKHSGSGFMRKNKGKKEDTLTFLFATKNPKCINKDIVILKNSIINFKKNNYKKKKTAYFRYHIWKIVRSFDAHWKEKRYKENPLLYIGRDLLINPDYFEFAGMYKQMLARIQIENVSYLELKKTIEIFSFLAERYVVWFLDNKKEDREKHMMIYKLTKNPMVFNKK